MLHQFSTIRALLLSIFHTGQCNMYDILPQKPNPHLFKIRIQKQMGGTGLWYCKVSHVVFIILVVQIFCLKCIYHFAGLLFSYLSFCRFTLLHNIQKVLSFSGLSFSRFVFLLFRHSNLSFSWVIIFLGKVCKSSSELSGGCHPV